MTLVDPTEYPCKVSGEGPNFDPGQYVNHKEARRMARFTQLAKHKLDRYEQRLERAQRLLKTLGPESAFERGFSITLTGDGKLVTDPGQVKPGDQLVTRVAGGTIASEVTDE